MAFTASDLSHEFRERFASEPTSIHRAPGRVNLIGEHTDYNLGFVMPIAIGLECLSVAAPGRGKSLRVYSANFDEMRELDPANLQPRKDWTDYVAGVAVELGVDIEPTDLLVHSTVPVGAGLSSSASIEVATALALAAGRITDPLQIVHACHRAENRFVGLPSGIMDQFISVFGEPGCALMLDCRSLEFKQVRLPANVAIIAVNTMVKHELGSSAYRERVAECAAAVAWIKREHPAVASLRDATLDMLSEDMPAVPRSRARHIVTENARVQSFAAAASAGDLMRMGELFFASHSSLSGDYQVSCEELDLLVDTAAALPGVYGARMTGGGFGGCTVNLVEPAQAEAFKRAVTSKYSARFGLTPQIYDCQASAGAGPKKL